jgi:predicted permease
MLSIIRAWFRTPDDLSEEMELHLEALKDERLALGDTEAQAERYARIKLGNGAAVREAVHEMSPFKSLETAFRYFLLAFRALRRHKAEYLLAVGILALGIGMSVAMFSLVDAVLLRPLPFPGQESIMVIWKAIPHSGTVVGELAYPELNDLQQNIADFDYVAVMPTSLYGYARVLQTSSSAQAVQIESAPVSHDFFRVLGITPLMGRDFTSSDEQVGAPPVVVISDRVWRQQLAADPKIIGKLIRLNGQGHIVIGVMAPGAEFPRDAGLWIPLGIDEVVVTHRGAAFLQAIARLKPGRSRNLVRQQVNGLFRRLAADHPDSYSPSQQGVMTPLVEYWTGSARLHLWIMLGAALLLLIAATISSGNLLLSRTLSRRPEIATRLALGAKRRQILSHLAAEGTLVAMLAAAGGLAIGQTALRLLVRWAPADIPRLPDAVLDFRSFCFATAVAVFAAIACSVIPGWSATRTNLERALREGSGRASMSRQSGKVRSIFVLAQVAATMMLLSIAALLVLSYRSMMAADIGFTNHETVSMNLQLRGPGLFSSQAFELKARHAFYTRLLACLRQSPGVTSAAAVLLRPLEGTIGWDTSYEFGFEAGSKDRRTLPSANYEVVTPGYFQTVGTILLEGRDFNEHDLEDSENVVIISHTLAQSIRAAGYLPVGHRIHLGLGGWRKVIGVSADARYRSVTQAGANIFVPYLQARAPTNYLVIRGRMAAADLAGLVRRTLAEIDSNQAMAGVATLGELIDRNTARHRFNMFLLLWFGICAAILAATAVYSVVAETMAARRREIAIKTALGASRPRLVREMVSGTLRFALIGEGVGVAGTVALGSFASDLLYGVSPRDPILFGSLGAFLFLVSVISASWPVWTVAGSKPTSELRAN